MGNLTESLSTKRFSVLGLVSFAIFILQWYLIYKTPANILVQRLLPDAPSKGTILNWISIVFAIIFVRTYASLIFTESEEFTLKVINVSNGFQRLSEWVIRLAVTISLYLSTLALTSNYLPFTKHFLIFSGMTFISFLMWDFLLMNRIFVYDSLQFWSWLAGDLLCVGGFLMFLYLRNIPFADLQAFCLGIFLLLWLLPALLLIIDLVRKYRQYYSSLCRACTSIVKLTT